MAFHLEVMFSTNACSTVGVIVLLLVGLITPRRYASAAYVVMLCLSVCLCVYHVREFCQND